MRSKSRIAIHSLPAHHHKGPTVHHSPGRPSLVVAVAAVLNLMAIVGIRGVSLIRSGGRAIASLLTIGIGTGTGAVASVATTSGVPSDCLGSFAPLRLELCNRLAHLSLLRTVLLDRCRQLIQSSLALPLLDLGFVVPIPARLGLDLLAQAAILLFVDDFVDKLHATGFTSTVLLGAMSPEVSPAEILAGKLVLIVETHVQKLGIICCCVPALALSCLRSRYAGQLTWIQKFWSELSRFDWSRLSCFYKRSAFLAGWTTADLLLTAGPGDCFKKDL
jgi:hypothetical protein